MIFKWLCRAKDNKQLLFSSDELEVLERCLETQDKILSVQLRSGTGRISKERNSIKKIKREIRRAQFAIDNGR